MKNNILLGLSFMLMVVALYLVFIYVPTDKVMGIVQRIFYFHVPLAWVAFLAFFVVFISSILYLWKRGSKWDTLAYSSAEIGVIFTTLVLITGPIWAKPTWGVWWTWDPRLTTALVLWLIYVAYLMVSSFATEESRGSRYAAVVGIVGFINVPLVALATTLWRGMHPGPVIFEGGLAPSMLFTLLVCLAAFTALYFLLLIQRASMKNDEGEIRRLKEFLVRHYN
ncbi:MAG: cytochrome c biogenesis protein CcsA [Dehalococcoidales bacterium]|nr:cytochrome c biogenesis protein CcsA [Dehalococcoidales bacterium]